MLLGDDMRKSLKAIRSNLLLCFCCVYLLVASLVGGTILTVWGEATETRSDWVAHVMTLFIIGSALTALALFMRILNFAFGSGGAIRILANIGTIVKVSIVLSLVHIGLAIGLVSVLDFFVPRFGALFNLIITICGSLGAFVGIAGTIEFVLRTKPG